MGISKPVEDFSEIEDSKLTSVESALFFAQMETDQMNPIEIRYMVAKSVPDPWREIDDFDVVKRFKNAIMAVKVNEDMTVRQLLDKAFTIVEMTS